VIDALQDAIAETGFDEVTMPLQCARTVLANFKKAGIWAASTSAAPLCQKASAAGWSGMAHRSLNSVLSR